MSDVDDYIASLPSGADRSELVRLHQLVCTVVDDLGQATSYGMPCYTYRGRPLAAVIVRRKHIAWYPFSGAVLGELSDHLHGRSSSPGCLRFSSDEPLSEDLVVALLTVRMRHIDQSRGDLGSAT